MKKINQMEIEDLRVIESIHQLETSGPNSQIALGEESEKRRMKYFYRQFERSLFKDGDKSFTIKITALTDSSPDLNCVKRTYSHKVF